MIHRLFTIHDQKAKAYLPPSTLHQVGMAVRAFADAINDPTHAFARNPGDYTLCEIGTFDDECAKITTTEVPISHGSGLQYVNNPDIPLNGD